MRDNIGDNLTAHKMPGLRSDVMMLCFLFSKVAAW